MRESPKINVVTFESPAEAVLISPAVPWYPDGWAAHSAVMGSIGNLGQGLGVTRLSIASYRGVEIDGLRATLKIGDFLWTDPTTGSEQAQVRLAELQDTGLYAQLPEVGINWGDGYGWGVGAPYADAIHDYAQPGEYTISIDFPGARHPYAEGYLPLQTGWSRTITIS